MKSVLDVRLKEKCCWMWFEDTGLYLFKGKMFHCPKQGIMISIIGKFQLGDIVAD